MASLLLDLAPAASPSIGVHGPASLPRGRGAQAPGPPGRPGRVPHAPGRGHHLRSGDGVTQVAGVLLAVSLTRSPLRLAGLPQLYLVFALVGLAGVVYESAATTVLPTLVGPAGRPRANGRLQAGASLSRGLVALTAVIILAWRPFRALPRGDGAAGQARSAGAADRCG